MRSRLGWLDWLRPGRRGQVREEELLADALRTSRLLERAICPEWMEPGQFPGSLEASGSAHGRGLKLLREHLSPSQRAQFEKLGYFEVVGGQSGRRYRIRTGTQMNIERLGRGGRVLQWLCFVPQGNLVAGDVMLAQKFALELYEADALKVANKFSVG